jgi:hypothetical protein
MRSANKGLQDKESESKKCERLVFEGVNVPYTCRYYCVPGMWATASYAQFVRVLFWRDPAWMER